MHLNKLKIPSLIFFRTHEIKSNLIYLGLSKACVDDADCADQCEFGKGHCDREGHCECPGGKFAEKFAPGHHSKKQE